MRPENSGMTYLKCRKEKRNTKELSTKNLISSNISFTKEDKKVKAFTNKKTTAGRNKFFQ